MGRRIANTFEFRKQFALLNCEPQLAPAASCTKAHDDRDTPTRCTHSTHCSAMPGSCTNVRGSKPSLTACHRPCEMVNGVMDQRVGTVRPIDATPSTIASACDAMVGASVRGSHSERVQT